MLDRLASLETELDQLEARLSEVFASGDQAAAREAGRRHATLRPIVEAYRELKVASGEAKEARDLLGQESDPDMRGFLLREAEQAESQVEALEGRLQELLLPRDPNDDRPVIVEIRGTEGGDEANLFAGDLFRMYQRYAERRGWKLEVLASQPSDLGGFKEVAFSVKGDGAWSSLQHEAGPHRVQRVPATESQGRIHTSAATVAVLPEAEEVEVVIDPNDLKIEVFRSSGPGGQSVNTTDSAVRLKHLPSGLVVSCQDEKSQLQNKDKALRILRSRLLHLEQERHDEEMSATRRDQLGGGGRSEKVRTYNFRENRVTDHRVGVTLYKLNQVLEGDLDELVVPLQAAARAALITGEG
ncbi:MAG: peptide chain release factor 1 [Acidimicrobiia bacterium]